MLKWGIQLERKGVRNMARNNSGIGVKLGNMTNAQFNRHLKRVLGRMYTRNASVPEILRVQDRIYARRDLAKKASK